jgi:ACT domain-containing protein
MRRVMDLPGWTPSYGSSKGHGGVAPTIEQILIDGVSHVADNHVDFTGTSGAGPVAISFAMPDRDTAEKVAAILETNCGKPLLSIASIEIPEN